MIIQNLRVEDRILRPYYNCLLLRNHSLFHKDLCLLKYDRNDSVFKFCIWISVFRGVGLGVGGIVVGVGVAVAVAVAVEVGGRVGVGVGVKLRCFCPPPPFP